MGAFEYSAVDPTGKQRKGVMEGDTARHVRQLLREQSLIPLAVDEVSGQNRSERRGFSLRRGMSSSDLSLITRQLATLVRSSMPLEEALLAVSQQNDVPRIKTIVLGVRARVMEGHTLADGLADFPRAFPELYRATVSAGEQSGKLDGVLERLADYMESRQLLKQRVTNAMIYPIVLVLMSFGIVAGMLVYVVPKVINVFRDTGQELPWLTQALISTSDFLREYGLILFIVGAALAWIIRRIFLQPGPRRRWHYFLLRLPLVGKLVRGINTARFSRTMSILTGSGVPVLDSLRISGQVVANLPMRDAIEEAAARVREGEAIGSSLANSRVFPPIFVHLVSSGEASGDLDNMLERASANQEREMDALIGALLGILEPILIIAMGVAVLTIVLAILMPIFELNDLIG